MLKADKPPGDPELKRRIQELIAYKGGGHNPDHVEDIIENALKLLTDVKDRGVLAIQEVRQAHIADLSHAGCAALNKRIKQHDA